MASEFMALGGDMEKAISAGINVSIDLMMQIETYMIFFHVPFNLFLFVIYTHTQSLIKNHYKKPYNPILISLARCCFIQTIMYSFLMIDMLLEYNNITIIAQQNRSNVVLYIRLFFNLISMFFLTIPIWPVITALHIYILAYQRLANEKDWTKAKEQYRGKKLTLYLVAIKLIWLLIWVSYNSLILYYAATRRGAIHAIFLQSIFHIITLFNQALIILYVVWYIRVSYNKLSDYDLDDHVFENRKQLVAHQQLHIHMCIFAFVEIVQFIMDMFATQTIVWCLLNEAESCNTTTTIAFNLFNELFTSTCILMTLVFVDYARLRYLRDLMHCRPRKFGPDEKTQERIETQPNTTNVVTVF